MTTDYFLFSCLEKVTKLLGYITRYDRWITGYIFWFAFIFKLMLYCFFCIKACNQDLNQYPHTDRLYPAQNFFAIATLWNYRDQRYLIDWGFKHWQLLIEDQYLRFDKNGKLRIIEEGLIMENLELLMKEKRLKILDGGLRVDY